MIPEAYIYPKEKRPIRDLLRERMRLAERRASEYGSISRMLLRHNIQGYNRNAVKHLTEKETHMLYHHPLARMKAVMNLQRIDIFSNQIKTIEKEILQSRKRFFIY